MGIQQLGYGCPTGSKYGLGINISVFFVIGYGYLTYPVKMNTSSWHSTREYLNSWFREGFVEPLIFISKNLLV